MTRYDTAQVTLFDGADVQPVLNSNGPPNALLMLVVQSSEGKCVGVVRAVGPAAQQVSRRCGTGCRRSLPRGRRLTGTA